MSERITGELRGAMATGARLTEFDGHILDETIWANRAEFENLCDAIDAIHANLERENESLRRELDRVLGEMEEHHAWAPESHYMMLPKDADGEPIHVGDVMEWPDGNTFEVVGVDNIGTLYYIDAEEDGIDWTNASDKHHHHEPTVEDVLRGVVTLCHNTWKDESAFKLYDVDDVMKSGNIAGFAAKLRLAGDAE